MNEQKVFINYSPKDRVVAEQIRDWLTAEGIGCAMLTEVDSLEAHFQVMTQVEDTIESKGALVVVLSRAALKSCWLISNAQYSCELAARRTVLVVYQIEDLPYDHPLALYYAQAVVVYASKKGADPSTRLVNTVKRVLANTDAPKAFRPRHLPKRLLRWMVGIVAVLAVVLGVGSYFLPLFLAPSAKEPPAIPTPVVVFEEPFKGESVDQGIIVDRRYVPDFVPTGDPQEDAPFFFEPAAVHKRFSFDDPAHENIDVLNLNAVYSSIAVSLKDQNAIRQTSGSLQIAMAPIGAQNMTEFGFGFPHLVSTDNFEYLGMRFFIEPYQGWSDVNLPNQVGFGFTHQSMPLLMIDLSRQRIETPNGEVFDAGSGWHTLEVLADPLNHSFDVYLDGDWVSKSSLVTDINTLAQFFMFLSVRHATEWVNFYIDELVYGGSEPLTTAQEPEEALYKITPDEVLYFNTFDVESLEELLLILDCLAAY